MKKIALIALSIFLIFSWGCKTQSPSGDEKTFNSPEQENKPYVILISIDGFRYDYAEKHGAVNIQKLAKNGVQAESMTSTFPSKTFPNHYSIATGLYAENHGLVSNTFYDPELDLTYKISNRERVEDGRFYGGTPLWVLAENQGMKSACFFWIGSEAKIKEVRPSYYYVYNGSIPNQDRVDKVVEWLELPSEERPHFITLYFSDVDSKGHTFGPDADETKAAVQDIDKLIGDLDQRANALGLPVNIIIVSDHGMIEVDRDNPVRIDQMADFGKVNLVYAETHCMIHSEDSAEIDRLYEELKPQAGDKFRIYKNEETPDSLHFKNNARIGQLLLVANAPNIFKISDGYGSKGVHGFDPYSTPEMGAAFFGNGPAFKEGLTIPVFDNVHVYPLITNILGLKIDTPVDGDISVLKNALK